MLSKQYLEGALTLDAAQRDKGRILFLPTLALAGHGLELMLKACIRLNGQEPPKSGGKGHDVVSMWQTEVCEPVRGHVFKNATTVEKEARASGAYPDTVPQNSVLTLIEEYIFALGNLHGETKVYPLRYPSDLSREAPRTPFLVKSLWATADDLVKRPSEFELHKFRDQL